MRKDEEIEDALLLSIPCTFGMTACYTYCIVFILNDCTLNPTGITLCFCMYIYQYIVSCSNRSYALPRTL